VVLAQEVLSCCSWGLTMLGHEVAATRSWAGPPGRRFCILNKWQQYLKCLCLGVQRSINRPREESIGKKFSFPSDIQWKEIYISEGNTAESHTFVWPVLAAVFCSAL